MTADELFRLPDDGYRYELVQGELRKYPLAGCREGALTARILANLPSHSRDAGTLMVAAGFILARRPDTVRAPDIAFVRKERDAKTDLYFPGHPDLAIEVISPSDLYSEVAEKTSEYLAAGTRAVVIVDPGNAAIHVHRPSSAEKVADTLDVADIIPGWKMPLAAIFAE